MKDVNMDVMNEAVEVAMDPAVSGKGGMIGLAIGLGTLAVAGAGALIYKSRGKFEEMNVRRLEKKGYVVTKAEPVDDEKTSKKK